MTMPQLFDLMNEKKASDMFFATNTPIHLKINGQLVPINDQKLDHDRIMALLESVISPQEMALLKQEHELNTGIGAEHIGRFRLSAFRQRGTISAVFRFIPNYIPTIDELRLPTILSDLIMEKRGLILLVGATGCGKSTTIASMLDYRNTQKSGHILTIEDPIEFLFHNKKSIMNQREVGTDTLDYATALRNSLRQAPDCILIGEIRDVDTMSAAMSYAQSGHLVLATLHANNSYHALNRIISFFPVEHRATLLLDLSTSVRAIISQRLIPTIQNDVCPAVEVLLNTRHVADLIADANIAEIKEAIEKSLSPGSQTFEQALIELVRSGLITRDEALINADSATNLLWMLNNELPNEANARNEVAPTASPAPDAPTFSGFKLNT